MRLRFIATLQDQPQAVCFAVISIGIGDGFNIMIVFDLI